MLQDGQKLHALKKTRNVQALYWNIETMKEEFEIQGLQRKDTIISVNDSKHST